MKFNFTIQYSQFINDRNTLSHGVQHYVNFGDRCGNLIKHDGLLYKLIEVYWIKTKPNRYIRFCIRHDAIDSVRVYRNWFHNNSQAERSLAHLNSFTFSMLLT